MKPDAAKLAALVGQETATVLAVFLNNFREIKSIEDYCRLLSLSADLYLKVGGLANLLQSADVDRNRWEEVVALSEHGAIAQPASQYFTRQYEYAWAERAIATYENCPRPSLGDSMRAALELDDARLLEFHRRLYLHTADAGEMLHTAEHAEILGGWRDALVWLARAAVLTPAVPQGAMSLFDKLLTANQPEALEAVLDVFTHADMVPTIRTLFRGKLELAKGNAETALRILDGIRLDKVPASVASKVCQARAEASEKLRKFQDAYRWYEEMNRKRGEGAQRQEVKAYLKRLDVLGDGPAVQLPDDPRLNYFMMLGFPRSGTTLLENALSSHPLVETFEEVPGMSSCLAHIRRSQPARGAEPPVPGVLVEARERYYRELDRRSRNAGAAFYVDKMPMYSQYAKLFQTIFPKKKYIFSIRHPYDVVLSCYKQDFKLNAAMAFFLNIQDACQLYDLTMANWFESFGLDDERVYYLHYENLVLDFQNEMRKILGFLGVPWNDDIERFAEFAQQRRVKTPSYTKVRQGLSIGVQTSWENYRFLFDTPHGARLNKWIEKFGYNR